MATEMPPSPRSLVGFPAGYAEDATDCDDASDAIFTSCSTSTDSWEAKKDTELEADTDGLERFIIAKGVEVRVTGE
jgi:hypothetical protein